MCKLPNSLTAVPLLPKVVACSLHAMPIELFRASMFWPSPVSEGDLNPTIQPRTGLPDALDCQGTLGSAHGRTRNSSPRTNSRVIYYDPAGPPDPVYSRAANRNRQAGVPVKLTSQCRAVIVGESAYRWRVKLVEPIKQRLRNNGVGIGPSSLAGEKIY